MASEPTCSEFESLQGLKRRYAQLSNVPTKRDVKKLIYRIFKYLVILDVLVNNLRLKKRDKESMATQAKSKKIKKNKKD